MNERLRNYLISMRLAWINATSSIRTAKNVEKSVKGIGTAAKTTTKQTNDLQKMMGRAMMVAPIWMAIRKAMMLVQQAVKSVIDTYADLDKGMRKVMAVATYTAATQGKVYAELEAKAVSYFRNSSKGMKDITEAMYQLGTAGRSTEEIMMGFKHIMDLSIGTYNDVAGTGRLVSGILNVFGEELKEYGSTTKQVQYVTDLLATAWKNNQIELKEMETAMSYLASAGNVLDIQLKELVASASVMSDAMLRGGKGGRLLARALIQVAKNSDKLRKLGVYLDPYKPMKYYDVMRQLHEIYEENGKSLQFLADLNEVFGTRGGRAVANVLIQWEKFNEEIKRTDENITGVSAKLKDIAEYDWKTLRGKAWKRMITGVGLGTGKSSAKEMFILMTGLREGEKVDKQLEKTRFMIKLLGNELKLTTKEAIDLAQKMTLIGAGEEAKSFLKQRGVSPMLAWEGTLPVGRTGIRGKKLMEELSEQYDILEKLGGTDLLKQVIENHNKGLEKSNKLVIDNIANAGKLIDIWGAKGKTIETMTKQEWQILKDLVDLDYKRIPDLKEMVKLKLEQAAANAELVETHKGLNTFQLMELENLKKATEYHKMKVDGVKKSVIQYEQLKDIVHDYNKMIQESKGTPEEIKGKGITLPDLLTGDVEKLVAGGVKPDVIKSMLKDVEKYKQQVYKETHKITEKEKEQLDISHKIKMAKASELFTTTELLNLEIQLVEASEHVYGKHAKRLKLLELEQKQLEENAKIMGKYSKEIRGAFKEGLLDFASGETDILGFIDSIGTKLRESMSNAIAESFTSKFMDATGFDKFWGEMMGKIEIGDSIKIAHDEGSNLTYQRIVQGFTDGAKMIPTGTGSMGMPTGVPSVMGGAPMGAAPYVSGTDYAKNYPGGTQYSGLSGLSKPSDPTLASSTSMFSKMGGFGGMLGMGAGMYSAYNQGGAGQAAAMGIGTGLMMFGGPVGMIAGGLLSMFSGLFGKKKKTTTHQTSWNAQDVEEMLPNLGINIAPPEKMYPLPSSNYFVSNITVRIDKVEGEGIEIADKIADVVDKKVNESVAQNYMKNLTRSISPKKIGY